METDILEDILDGRKKPTNLPFALLKNITEHFSEEREIGHGGFATVYKGDLPNGNVAVKRIKSRHSIDEKKFHREVNSLLTVNHQNVVRFLGFCASTEQTAIKVEGSNEYMYAEIRERLFCFEYISNGNLQKYITDELRGLDWNTRYRIIMGICEGLHHLHVEKHIYHMDLKPANILIDNHMVPKITDFGLSRLDEKSHTMSKDRHGTRGYCAPEYLLSGKMSFKSDMYSLGVLIIELVTGEKGIPDNKKNNVLRRWRHRWKKSGEETTLGYQQVTKCIELGQLCQISDPCKRPFIWDIIHDIKMEGTNGSINNAIESTVDQISPYSEDDMLGVEPLELHFPFKLKKQMSCSLRLTNETDSHIAFNIQKMRPLPYCIQPEKGIVLSRSECSVDITLQPQDKTPGDMQRAEEFIVWSTKVNADFAVENITKDMFIKETGGVVDAVNLGVVFEEQLQSDLLDVLSSVHQEAPLPSSSSETETGSFKTDTIKHRSVLDHDRVPSMCNTVADGIHKLYAGDISNVPMVELYRSSFNLVLHNGTQELHSVVKDAMVLEVEVLGRSLDGIQDGTMFLHELLGRWYLHSTAVAHIRDLLSYIYGSFFPVRHKMAVHNLGVRLWRDNVVLLDKVRPRLIEGVTAAATDELLAGVAEKLREMLREMLSWCGLSSSLN
uniref:Uncharacterized protein n=3 Tax=Avena sativa TaxID=4498 RepID=A0ACD6ABL2_AVESA